MSSPFRYALLLIIGTFTLSKAYISETTIQEVSAVGLPLPQRTTDDLYVTDTTKSTLKRLAWCPEGHSTWDWDGHKINYIEMGDPSKPALLLIHGFGVSSYHFRSNIPELAENYHVFAFDMLGFGCSTMPIQDYEPEVWRDQTVAFVKDVIGKPTSIAGNSLGGLAALYAATSTKLKPWISSCILLNAALRFKSRDPTPALLPKDGILASCMGQMMEPTLTSFARMLLGASFHYTKRTEHIKKVLHNVYAVDSANVDDELIESIQHSSRDENAAEVYYRVLSKNGPFTDLFADDLLGKLDCPLLLCWGTKDPWFKASTCERIQSLYDKTTRMDINAGHCVHDESPREVNEAIHAFLTKSLDEDGISESSVRLLSQ